MWYPFVKCLEPRVVRNPYTHERRLVGCGKCAACLTSKAGRNSFLCQLEESKHTYCYFVTLTYDDNSIPLLQPVYEPENHGYRLYNLCQRMRSLGPDFGLFVSSQRDFMRYLLRKINLRGKIGYANPRDFQLFMKRFRYYQQKYKCDEKVRYYAVSEYGPVHFRPHFHLLLFFESPRLAQRLGRVIRSSWKFGFVDYSLSRSKCSSYCAQYVNSAVCIPGLFKDNAAKPFCSHSSFFGESIPQSEKKTVYETPFDEFVEQSAHLNGKDVNYHPWRSYTSRFFPRCRKYSDLSHREKCRSYSILLEAFEEYGHRPISELSQLIYNSDLLNPVKDFFQDDKNEDTIATHLYLSKRFLSFVCDGVNVHYVGDSNIADVYREIDEKVYLIESFYRYLDYVNLVQWYEDMSLYCDSYPGSRLDFFYDNWNYDPRGICSSPLFSTFYSDSYERQSRSIKHKKLNDLNKIFF